MGNSEPDVAIESKPVKGSKTPVGTWFVILFIALFPASLVTASIFIPLGRKGFSRINIGLFSGLLSLITVYLFLKAAEPLKSYQDVFLSLGNMVGLTTNKSLSPDYLMFSILGLTIGGFIAIIFTTAWRYGFRRNPEWQSRYPEGKNVVSIFLSRGKNLRVKKRNDDVIQRITEGNWFGNNEVGLGYAISSIEPGQEIIPIGLPDMFGGSVSHSLILGSSGRGKTQTIIRQAFDAIKKGDPVLVVDAKGDGDLASTLGAYAEKYGRPFYHFSIPSSTSAPYVGSSSWGRAFYDPAGLLSGNHTRRRDFMMNARDWQGAPAVYSDKTRDWLSRALWVDNVVAECNGGKPLGSVPQATFSRIAELMSPISARNYLREAAGIFGIDALNESFGTTTYSATMAELENYIEMKDQTGESARMSHAAWLRTFMSSITGPYLRDTGDSRTISINRIVDEEAVCVFDLATDQYREEAPAIARLVVADLLSYISGVGKSDVLRLRVFLDEFAAVGGDESANVLARARSAGVSFTLSTQTLSDLRDVSTAFEGQVLTNSLNLLIHNASTWDEAERLAGMTGQVEFNRITRSSKANNIDDFGMRSVSLDKRFRIEPSEFMEMGVGELVKISQVEKGDLKAIKVAVVMPEKITGTTYTVDTDVSTHHLGDLERNEEQLPVEPRDTQTQVDFPTTPDSLPLGETQILETQVLDEDPNFGEAAESVSVTNKLDMALLGDKMLLTPEDTHAEAELKATQELDVDEEVMSPLDYVTETEPERKKRLMILSANSSLFNSNETLEESTVNEIVVEPQMITAPTTQRPVRKIVHRPAQE